MYRNVFEVLLQVVNYFYPMLLGHRGDAPFFPSEENKIEQNKQKTFF